jgi:hypothetical protein
MRSIASHDPSRQSNVFMKVGASGTVSTNLLTCFAGSAQPQYTLDLGGRDALMPSIAFFREGDAAGSTPFDRTTIAALVGHTASWVISGNPSPLLQETAAVNPRFAVVNYGTNDMEQGSSYATAIAPFYESMSTLLDQLDERGIVTVLTGLNPRADSVDAALWVPTYDAMTRGLAEARQLPFIDLYLATHSLANMGLGPDGLHGNVYSVNGQAQPCVFTDAGLAFNYDVRNLLTIEALDVTRRVVNDGESAPDSPGPSLVGDGSFEAPFVIDSLPFTHSANTANSSSRRIDAYGGCSATQDESGPEIVYRLDLTNDTPSRVIVLDRGNVDVDVHLLGASLDGASCIARNDRILERVIPAGIHHIAVDTYVSNGIEHSGEYLLVVVACEPGDPDCGGG